MKERQRRVGGVRREERYINNTRQKQRRKSIPRVRAYVREH